MSAAPPSAAAVVAVGHPDGLHLRPLTELAKLAAGLPCRVTLTKAGPAGPVTADAAVMMQTLTLAAGPGDELTVAADGPGAPEAVEAVRRFVAAGAAAGG